MESTSEAQKFGPIWLAPGITRSNLVTKFYASAICIAMLSAITFLQPYILTEHLQVPREVQGTISGDLQFWNQIVAILLLSPFGMLCDRIGRRPVLIFGILITATGLALTPFASSVAQLLGIRLIYAVGTAAASTASLTITNDYPQERSRGKMIGINSIMTNMGLVLVTLGLAQMPAALVSAGYEAVDAGRMTFLVAAAICVVSAVIFRIGLKGGTPVSDAEQPGLKTLLVSGFRAAHNPRIALSYATSFSGRSNNVIRGVFLPLWAVQAGAEAGLDPGAAMARFGLVFFALVGIGMAWGPTFGFLMDRLNRVTAQAVALGIGTVGYLSMALVDSPLEMSAFPLLILLTLGAPTPLMASVGLLGQEAPVRERGTIFGMSGLIGAVGILVFTKAGGPLYDSMGPSGPFVMMGLVQGGMLIAAIAVRLLAPGPQVVKVNA